MKQLLQIQSLLIYRFKKQSTKWRKYLQIKIYQHGIIIIIESSKMVKSQISAFKQYSPEKLLKKNKWKYQNSQLRDNILKKIKEKNRSKRDMSAIVNKFEQFCMNSVKISQVTCPVCLQIFICPTIVQCGHIFCINCIQTALFSNKQCPICRRTVVFYDFKCSILMDKLIKHYISSQYDKEEMNVYLDRIQNFKIDQQKRRLPSVLGVNYLVDFRGVKEWITAKIQDIDQNQALLSISEEGKSHFRVRVSLHSRNLAKYKSQIHKQPKRELRCALTIDMRVQLQQLIPGFYTLLQNHVWQRNSNRQANHQQQTRIISEFDYYNKE